MKTRPVRNRDAKTVRVSGSIERHNTVVLLRRPNRGAAKVPLFAMFDGIGSATLSAAMKLRVSLLHRKVTIGVVSWSTHQSYFRQYRLILFSDKASVGRELE